MAEKPRRSGPPAAALGGWLPNRAAPNDLEPLGHVPSYTLLRHPDLPWCACSPNRSARCCWELRRRFWGPCLGSGGAAAKVELKANDPGACR